MVKSEAWFTCIAFIPEHCIDQLRISALEADDLDYLEWKWNRRRTPMPRPRLKVHLMRSGPKNHTSTDTIDTVTPEVESTITAAITTYSTQTEILKLETVVKFGRKFLKVVKGIKKQ